MVESPFSPVSMPASQPQRKSSQACRVSFGMVNLNDCWLNESKWYIYKYDYLYNMYMFCNRGVIWMLTEVSF